MNLTLTFASQTPFTLTKIESEMSTANSTQDHLFKHITKKDSGFLFSSLVLAIYFILNIHVLFGLKMCSKFKPCGLSITSGRLFNYRCHHITDDKVGIKLQALHPLVSEKYKKKHSRVVTFSNYDN